MFVEARRVACVPGADGAAAEPPESMGRAKQQRRSQQPRLDLWLNGPRRQRLAPGIFFLSVRRAKPRSVSRSSMPHSPSRLLRTNVPREHHVGGTELRR